MAQDAPASEIPSHLQPDETDERVALRMSKKHVPPLPVGACVPRKQLEEELRTLRYDCLVPTLVRITTASREGCAPRSPHYELNAGTHTLSIQNLSQTASLRDALWDSEDSDTEQPVTPLLLQTPPHAAMLQLTATSLPNAMQLTLPTAVSSPASTAPPLRLTKSDVLSMLPQLGGLTTVSITHNYRLHTLPCEAIHALPFLKRLDVSYNALERVPATLFLRRDPQTGRIVPAIPDLQELHLHNNRLQWLPKQLFSMSPRLQLLSVGNNYLSGFPSTLGNCCTPSSALKRLLMHNNVMSTDLDAATEVRHAVATYHQYCLKLTEYLERLRSPSFVVERDRERNMKQSYLRLPLSREPDHLETHEINVEVTRVLHVMLRRELDLLPHAPCNDTGAASDPFLGTQEARWEQTTCNLCQAELAPIFAAYRTARQARLAAMQKAALGSKYTAPSADFSFFLSSNDPPELPPFHCVEADASSYLAWEKDEELLWVVGEACNGGHVVTFEYEPNNERYEVGEYVPVIPRREGGGGALSSSSTQKALDDMRSFLPPYGAVKYCSAAGNCGVPLMYFLCGSEMCRKSIGELSTDGNAAQDFSRIDYHAKPDDVSDDD